ncbi:MAG TPA: type II secretion system protein [Gemmatimonadales bacterium]|nr:type II secretion system protein [Gemmatimonadales bacterium]
MGSTRRGFTFIELLIVCLIVGIVVAFAAPKIDVTKFKIESAMQGVGITLLGVERQAITQQHDIIVMFDVANQALRIHEDNNDNGQVDAGERVRSVPLGDQVVFGRGAATAMSMGNGPVTFTKVVNGYPALVFHRDGSASEAGGFYLTSKRALNYSGGYTRDSRAILVDRATGRASWYRYGTSTWVKAF